MFLRETVEEPNLSRAKAANSVLKHFNSGIGLKRRKSAAETYNLPMCVCEDSIVAPAKGKTASGFTLVEFLIVLVVMAVLTGAVLPALGRFIEDLLAEQKTSALRASIRLAREEAMRRGEWVSLCARAADSLGGGRQCAPVGVEEWSEGWLIFVDRGTRGMFDAEDELIQVHQIFIPSIRIYGSSHHLSYAPTGIAINAASNFRLLGRTESAELRAKTICVSKTGKMRATTGNACS